jgi:hypothetical protein
MLNVTYNREDDRPALLRTWAECQLPLFGRWCNLHLTAYHVGNGTAITFGLREASMDQIRYDRGNASCNGMLNLGRGSGSDRQYFEQAIPAPNVIGQFLDWSTLQDGEVTAARTVSEAILRKVESLIETVRQSIRNNLGKNAKDQAVNVLGERYDDVTKQAVRDFLGQLNWALLLDGSGLTDQAQSVIDYTLSNNPVDMYSIGHDDDTGIPLIQYAELKRFDKTTLANIKASALLRKVCGDKLGDMFDQHGKIVITENDYTFHIAPGKFVDCIDPTGKSDEVVISYLHIRNKFDAWMDMAIAHGAQAGFQKKRKKNG